MVDRVVSLRIRMGVKVYLRVGCPVDGHGCLVIRTPAHRSMLLHAGIMIIPFRISAYRS